MKLQKRECEIKAHIEPLGTNLLEVSFDFGNKKLEFTPSSAVFCGQFGDFICALYTLYHENRNGRFDGHSEWNDRKYHADENHEIQSTTVTVEWDNEGSVLVLEMTKKKTMIPFKSKHPLMMEKHIPNIPQMTVIFAMPLQKRVPKQ